MCSIRYINKTQTKSCRQADCFVRMLHICKTTMSRMLEIKLLLFNIGYSTADYAATVWARSPHAKNLDPGLNQACRSVTGCLKPTNIEDLYLLSAIAIPAIRRDVCTREERQKQSTRETHSLFGQIPATKYLKYRHCFLSSVQPANFPVKCTTCKLPSKRY